MVSINVQLEDDLANLVRKLAADQNRSESDIVSDALSAYARPARPLPKGMGKYRSGQNDGSERAREILRDAAKEGLWP